MFLLSYADHRLQLREPGKPDEWRLTSRADFPEFTTLHALPDMGLFEADAPLRMEFVESIRKPVVRVVLQYRELADSEANLPVSALAGLQWQQELVSEFTYYDEKANTYVSAAQRQRTRASALSGTCRRSNSTPLTLSGQWPPTKTARRLRPCRHTACGAFRRSCRYRSAMLSLTRSGKRTACSPT
ncbi:hypothetical protein LP419_39220 [Massilia sp. H-1]|nr:hypothetical protein LP419_39220 [Massilia sp. H-1]